MGHCRLSFPNPKLDDKTYNGEKAAKARSPAEPKPQSGSSATVSLNGTGCLEQQHWIKRNCE
ncbi:hypothetical protein CGRA01v4_07501 [Colletotrichum graminicola]|nr:hypothetical protein CGRA01v4_07501 [Colletotrichum graminicola]